MKFSIVFYQWYVRLEFVDGVADSALTGSPFLVNFVPWDLREKLALVCDIFGLHEFGESGSDFLFGGNRQCGEILANNLGLLELLLRKLLKPFRLVRLQVLIGCLVSLLNQLAQMVVDFELIDYRTMIFNFKVLHLTQNASNSGLLKRWRLISDACFQICT